MKLGACYNTEGQRKVLLVNGNTHTGIQNVDGSFNGVLNDGGGIKGLYHPCGAYNVVLITDRMSPIQARNGSYNIITCKGGYAFVDGKPIYVPDPTPVLLKVSAIGSCSYSVNNGTYTVVCDYDSSIRFEYDNTKLINGATYRIDFDVVSTTGDELYSDFCDVMPIHGPLSVGHVTYTGSRSTYDTIYRFIDIGPDEGDWVSFQIKNVTLTKI